MLDFRDKLATATGWNGRVLIIESAEETGFTLKERQILRSYYPALRSTSSQAQAT